MNCPNCGLELKEDEKVCRSVGSNPGGGADLRKRKSGFETRCAMRDDGRSSAGSTRRCGDPVR